MGLVVDQGEMLEIQVGIDLSGGQAGMAQHLLHRAQIAGGLQHVGGEGMAQGVGMHMGRDAMSRRQPLQGQAHRRGADAAAAGAEKSYASSSTTR